MRIGQKSGECFVCKVRCFSKLAMVQQTYFFKTKGCSMLRILEETMSNNFGKLGGFILLLVNAYIVALSVSTCTRLWNVPTVLADIDIT